MKTPICSPSVSAAQICPSMPRALSITPASYLHFHRAGVPGGSLQVFGSSPHSLGQKGLAQLQQAPSQLCDWWRMPATQRDSEKQSNPAPSLGFADRIGNTATDFAADDRSHKRGGWELLQRTTELPRSKHPVPIKQIFTDFKVQNLNSFLWVRRDKTPQRQLQNPDKVGSISQNENKTQQFLNQFINHLPRSLTLCQEENLSYPLFFFTTYNVRVNCKHRSFVSQKFHQMRI